MISTENKVVESDTDYIKTETTNIETTHSAAEDVSSTAA